MSEDVSEVSPNEKLIGQVEPSFPEHESVAERLRKTDPRDYIRVSCFQKQSRAIDQDISHPWEIIPDNYEWARDGMGEVSVARLYLPDAKRRGYLLAEKSENGESSSIFITEIDKAAGDYLFDLLSLVARNFPPEARQGFFKQVVSKAEELKAMTTSGVVEKITKMALNLLDDDPDAVQQTVFPTLPQAHFGPASPNSEQLKEMTGFFALISSKMPAGLFKSNFESFVNSIPFIDDVYGRNYPTIYTDVLGWVIRSREDMKFPREGVSSLVQRFPAEELAQREISTEEELNLVLEREPIKPEPKTRDMELTGRDVEFVDIDKIVGGPWLKTWTFIDRSDKEGRGTMKFVKGLRDGSISVAGKNSPIDVYEVNGDYFVGGDGTHRVAAMKTLKIPFAPMIVTHYR